MDLYKDNVEITNEILEKIGKSGYLEIVEMANTHFPTWIIDYHIGYSPDYEYLTRNWRKMCEIFKTTPQDVLVVDLIIFQDPKLEYRLIKCFSDRLTQLGYVVRRKGEFLSCKTCDRLIPCFEMWKMMREKQMPIPKIWSPKCSNC